MLVGWLGAVLCLWQWLESLVCRVPGGIWSSRFSGVRVFYETRVVGAVPPQMDQQVVVWWCAGGTARQLARQPSSGVLQAGWDRPFCANISDGVQPEQGVRKWLGAVLGNQRQHPAPRLRCFKAARRPQYASRGIDLYVPRTFVGGVFECPVVPGVRSTREFRCDPRLAVPLYPLIADDVTQQWLALGHGGQASVRHSVPFFHTPGPVEAVRFAGRDWAHDIHVNEEYSGGARRAAPAPPLLEGPVQAPAWVRAIPGFGRLAAALRASPKHHHLVMLAQAPAADAAAWLQQAQAAWETP